MLTCDLCAEPAMAVRPGSEPVHELFMLDRGEPLRCWCECHWREAHGVVAVVEDGAAFIDQ